MIISFKMTKIFIVAFTLTVFFLISTANVLAIGETGQCNPKDSLSNHGCDTNLYCKPFIGDLNRGSCEKLIGETEFCDPLDNFPNHACGSGLDCKSTANPNVGSCEKFSVQPPAPAAPTQPDPFAKIFGKIQLPDPLKGFGKDPTGAFGISQFLSNLIALFYSVAAIVLIFMLLWGAFEWITSGGDKEKIASARGRIISAIIGIMLFAVAFAIITILGQFTGFKFFEGQGVRVINEPGFKFECPDGTKVGGNVGNDRNVACKGHGT